MAEPTTKPYSLATNDEERVSDIYKARETEETRYRSKPGLHRPRTPRFQKSDLHSSLWMGIGVLATAIAIVSAFTVWLMRNQPR